MSSTDKTKLDGVATSADANVQSDWNATSGDAFIKNKPTIAYTSAISNATQSASGLMSSTDKTKLDGVATSADANVQSDWNATSGHAFIKNKPTIAYTSAISNATTSASGLMSSTDKTKLDGLGTYSAGDGVSLSGTTFKIDPTHNKPIGKSVLVMPNGSTEGGQITLVAPGVSQSDAEASRELNGWTIDQYISSTAYEQLGIITETNATRPPSGMTSGIKNDFVARIFSPLAARTGAAAGRGTVIFTPLGGVVNTGTLIQGYDSHTISITDATEAEAAMYGGTAGDDFTRTFSDGQLIVRRDVNPGLAFEVTDYSTTNGQKTGDEWVWNQFVGHTHGTMFFTTPRDTGSTTKMSIDKDGNLSTDGTVNGSDKRIKDNIVDIDEAERNIAIALKSMVKRFTRYGNNKKDFGFIAQDVIQLFAENGLDVFEYNIIKKTEVYAKYREDGNFEDYFELDERPDETKSIVTKTDGSTCCGCYSVNFSNDQEECIRVECDDGEVHLIEKEDIVSHTRVPKDESYVRTDMYYINYPQAYALIISAL